MKIEKLNKCTGCNACVSICPKSAIRMAENTEGFLFPYIDKNSCISCKLCEIICPINGPKKTNNINKSYKKEAYAFINENSNIRLESSSGGFFSAIAEYVINNDGFVYGVTLDSKMNAIFSYTQNINELKKFRGSKYVQANVGNVYNEIKELLNLNRLILFTGTPCQIAGLKNYLKKEYQNLFCIDFICHGVPSPKVWKKYKEEKEIEFNSPISNTSFRQKRFGWKMFSLFFLFENKKEYNSTLKEDNYLRLFLSDICLRKSCYNCYFKGYERLSDITMADFWGIQNEIPEIDDNKGVSLIIINSLKGKEFFSRLNNAKKIDVKFENAIKYNPAYYRSAYKRYKRREFFSSLNYMTIEELVKKYENKNVIDKLYINIIKAINKLKKIIF